MFTSPVVNIFANGYRASTIPKVTCFNDSKTRKSFHRMASYAPTIDNATSKNEKS